MATEPLTDSPLLHPGRAATLSLLGRRIGSLGEVHPDRAREEDLKGRVYLALIDLEAVGAALEGRTPKFQPFARFPGSERDLALVLDATVPAGDVLAAARKAGGELLEDLSIFDLYRGEHVAEGKVSLALRLRLRAVDRTLTEEEIQGTVDRIVKQLEKQFGATLRA